MHCNESMPWFASNEQFVTLPFPRKGGSSFSKFPIIRVDEPFTPSAGIPGADHTYLSGMPSMADLSQFVRELIRLCQAVGAAYERNRRLQAIVRPFLAGTTWSEAAEVARRGGHSLPTEIREASILWLDIASFTELMDSHTLDQVLADLNACLDRLARIVYRQRGEVSKYLGDGFLAVFADADAAVQAGCAIQGAATDFNRRQSARGGLVFPTRIGIDSGQVTITNLGPPERQDRTVIVMPVNLAERLQARATPGRVWLSQVTFDRLRDRSGCRYLGPIQVKGRAEPVIVYEKL
jgi:class 3 adenylate cyclase